ncbi:MAG: hypothetical protein A4E62_01763 [Syntrophorhabdus sp. PtaU1.Bin002]|nr:MAG: hypothetical protein A4E62_01763 [Syntrophorhabdus sp. PtaU1.Bin002]
MKIPRILMSFLLAILLTFLCSGFMVDTASGEKLYGVYDGNWSLTYYMQGDAVYDTQWGLQYHIRDNTLYDKNWQRRYFIEGAAIYNENRYLQYRIKEYTPPE